MESRIIVRDPGKTQSCTCICALFPAVMLDMVQQASFLMDSLGLLNK